MRFENSTQSKFNICNIFLCLYLLYNGGTFFPGITSQIFLISVIAISVYYFFYVNIYYKSSYIKVVSLLLALFTVYGLFYILSGNTIRFKYNKISSYTYIVNLYARLLPIFPIYAFCRKGLLNETKIRKWFLVFLLVVILTYHIQHSSMLLLLDDGTEEITNNVGYMFLSLFPLLYFYYRKPSVQYAFMLLILVYIILSMKRGAIIIAFICLMYFLFFNKTNLKKAKSRYYAILLSGILVMSLYNVTEYMYNNSAYFKFRVQKTAKGSSSGRDKLYTKAWNHLSQEPIAQFFFGNGANETYVILGNRAHNDWLELLINQGILGGAVYLAYWLVLFRYSMRAKHMNLVSNVLGAFVLIHFLKSFFSMSIDGMDLYGIIAVCWTTAIVDNNTNLKKQAFMYDYK